MMKIVLLLTGKTEEGWVKTAFAEYQKRLAHYCSLEIVEISALKSSGKISIQEQKEAEGKLQLSKLNDSDRLILLDEEGKDFSSLNFSKWIEKQQGAGYKRVVFLVGGPFGFSDAVYGRANEKISISKMTFSHQMIRPIFAEQLYRAFTIIRGEKYHHS